MNVWYIALWVYMLAGEAIMLIIAFDICRKEAAKEKKESPPRELTTASQIKPQS